MASFTYEELIGSVNTNPKPNKQFTFEEIYKDTTGVDYIPKLEDSYLDKWLPNWIKKGYNESITGMAERVVSGQDRFDISGYDGGILSDIGSAIVGFMMPVDLAATVAGGGVGSIATRGAAKTGLKRAMNMGAKRMVNFGLNKELTDKVIEEGAKKLLSNASIQAGAVGTYTGLNSALKQQIETNNIDWTKSLTDASKAGLSGAIGGALFGRAIARGSSTTAALTQEAIGFSTAEPILSGRSPDPQDYLAGLGTVLGIRTAQKAPSFLKNEFSKIKKRYSNQEFDPTNKLSSSDKNDLINLAEDYATQKSLAQSFSETWGLKKDIKGAYIPEVRISDEIRLKVPTDQKLYNQVVSSLKSSMKTVELAPTKKQIDKLYTDALQRSTGKKTNAFKDVKGFKIIEEGGSKSRNITSKDFFSVYNRNPLVRINAESLSLKLKNKLELDDDSFLAEFNNVELSKVGDGQLKEVNERLFKRVERNTIYKQFVEYSNEIPQKDLFDHVFGEKIARYFKSYQKSFKNPRAQNVAKLMANARNNIVERESSQLTNLTNSPLKKIKGNDARNKDVYAEVLGIKEITSENKDIVQWLQNSAKETYNYAGTGNIVRAGEIKNYLPIMYKPKVMNALFDDYVSINERFGKAFDETLKGTEVEAAFASFIKRRVLSGDMKQSSKDFIVAVKDTYGISMREAYDLVTEGITANTIAPMNFVEKTRKLKITKDNFEKLVPFLELDPFTLVAVYDHRLARRVETAKIFGRNNEVINNSVVQLQATAGREAALLTDGIAKLTGAVENDVSKNFAPTTRKYIQNLMAFETISKISLGTATFANIGQPLISIMPQLGMFRTVRGFVKLLDPEYRKKLTVPQVELVKELLGETGTGSAMRRYAEFFAKYSGFNPINKFNSLLAASVAKTSIDDFIKIATNNPNSIRGKQAIQKLKTYFNIDLEGNKLPTESQVVSGMANYARKSQLQRDFLREPNWFSNPKTRPLVMFKSFGYNQAKFIKDSIKSEMKMGNPLIFLRLGVGGFAGGKFVQWSKENIYSWLSGREVYNPQDTKWQEFIETMSSVGAFGMLTDFIDAEDFLGNVKFVVTPPFLSDLQTGFKALEEFSRSVDSFGFTQTSFRRAAYKGAPIFGSLPARAAERFVATEGQKRASQKSRKAREKTKILDYMMGGKTDIAKTRLLQWNKNNPRNPFTYNDIGHKAIYRKALQKRMKKIKENMPSVRV